jgi:aspartate/tyrosine/aromatic aminotransferase
MVSWQLSRVFLKLIFVFVTERQCQYLIREYHVYILKDGRINVAAITLNNIDYIANAIFDVVSNVKDEAKL